MSLLMAYHINEKYHQNLWCLDTKCSNHMSGDKSIFSSLDESYQNFIKFGDVNANERRRLLLLIVMNMILKLNESWLI
jgi:hypothetical protein